MCVCLQVQRLRDVVAEAHTRMSALKAAASEQSRQLEILQSQLDAKDEQAQETQEVSLSACLHTLLCGHPYMGCAP